jgi:hypothetical protein
MRRRHPPTSVSPNSFDPTGPTGSVKSGASGPVDVVLDGPVVLKTHTWQLRPDDKALMDSLQSWYHVRYGQQLTQWELFSRVLVEALTKPDGRFVGAFEAIGRERPGDGAAR